ncbi:hypothetical protein PHYSODRAFT_284665 [Phytophthora sojae]|uniref:RxLR effector protein n=2 Tax=Phytophthora sojae TaxID=67593 RepID=G4YRE0_PHYSP|nr:hypothetical protein PHYSODRAFT_284665 [Phytophthora sojae]AEK80567.1 Avh50 [Phytophthora sojae]AEK80568.1 Avh50 [Phytophthora sojae]AEK80569.1 Avh50 [Phytophthora sojae]EGZ22874.1 hypothetical protein PHYSODRAFT_284665 [Phytophthora sojae]|eukprot:XP_009518162.1 hypothetical protein PHYSODRAFT_284665 [Phytophthora sojae]
MQFVFVLLLLAASILLASSDVVSASVNKDVTLSKSTRSDLVHSANAGSVRLLRREDQNDESEDGERGLSRAVAEKAANAASKLTKSKSFLSEKAAVQKFARSKSFSDLKRNLNYEQLGNEIKTGYKSSLLVNFKVWNKQKRDPDEMFRFFNLDHRLAGATKADKHKIWDAAKQMTSMGSTSCGISTRSSTKRKTRAGLAR